MGKNNDTKEKDNGRKELIRSLKFVLISISAGIIEIGSFTLLNELLKLDYWVSYVIALVLSILWNFTINRRYTFKSASNVPKAMLLVFLFYVFFAPASSLLEHYLAGVLGWNEYLVTLINMALNLSLEFPYQRYFVFRDTLDTNEIAQREKQE